MASQWLFLSSTLLLSLAIPLVSATAPPGFLTSDATQGESVCANQCVHTKGCLSYLYDLTGHLAGQCGMPSSHTCFLFSTGSGGKGEPHFNGADGSHFDFSGVPGTTYTLFTDADLHVNAFFGGRYGQWGEDSHHSITWMRKIAVFEGHNTLVLEAREGAEWEYGTGYMARMSFNGQDFTLAKAGDVAELAGGTTVTWVAAKEASVDDLVDVYEVSIPGKLRMALTLRPEVALLRTAEDGTVHFDVGVKSIKLSSTAHGILGQTYRADHAGRFQSTPQVWSELLGTSMVATLDAEGFLDGKATDYATSGLLKTDSPVSRFVQAKEIDESATTFEEGSTSSSFSRADESVIRMNRKLLGLGF